MNRLHAKQILNWKYEQPYDFYNNEENEENLAELLENHYFSAVDQHDVLIGYCCIGKAAQVPTGSQFGAYTEEMDDIGIGLRPDLTGQGFGKTFFKSVIEFVSVKKGNGPLRLTVADFNERAIHLYKQFGFKKVLEFNRGTSTFVTMIKPVD
ncbi:N-acetyltransferase [Falsibacillus albus]|uniref:N-acetyltransferase n=2 Tax=Falsibacillus albus TaxID=2478915 RepID=A0A3L7JZW4_9BACI|nr:N-acetyltransferase [Falsibacillus albus]